ncbi:MAG: NAD(P)H-dependent oxidoreductase [Hyphomicrobiales bacterium]
MARLTRHVPVLASMAWILLAQLTGYISIQSRLLALLVTAAALYSVYRLAAKAEASPIHKGMALFTATASASIWLGPAIAWPARHPAAALYAVLFLVAVLPPALRREVFTTYFARKTAPPAVWSTAIFRTINRHLTALWAVLFAAGAVAALMPVVLEINGLAWETLFGGLIPSALMLAIGLPANKRYPAYYQRKLGLTPAGIAGTGSDTTPKASPEALTEATLSHKERQTMGSRFNIVAVNGSPHAGIGNTAMMLEMLRPALTAEGLLLEVINLCEQDIDYCIGCGVCMEKGRCWIQDDHAGIVERLLAADGIILASPVYFLHVTAQMKTFLDRSLAFGHKPQPDWKPGLAVSVSAGYGETTVAEYLGSLLRVYGAFSVGGLTALATGPGEFLGKSAIEVRARDLAGDLARAVKEKRRYPATDNDLIFYRFMGALVRDHRDSIMKDDFAHWEKLGLYRDFDVYVQQTREKAHYDPEMRKAWIQEAVARHKAKRTGKKSESRKASLEAGARSAKTCRELLKTMPLGFNAAAARGLEAIYQFDVIGSEPFRAYLEISGTGCNYHEGLADKPGIVIHTPGDVWMAIARGELDGQQAFMNGQYTVDGDLSLLLKLRSLFQEQPDVAPLSAPSTLR